jgi:anti-sigma factor RsiW
MRHEKAMQLLTDYAVGRLKGRAKIALEQHISECPICERELKALQQTEKLLRGVGLVRPSDPKLMLTRIRSATTQTARVSSRVWQWRTFWSYLWKPAIGFTLLALVVAATLSIWRQPPDHPDLSVSYEQYHRLVSWSNPLGNWFEAGLSVPNTQP